MNGLTLVLAIFSSLVVVPATAMAMEPYLPSSPKVFAKLDADSNGKITLSEIQPRAEKRFGRMDADNDGEVSTAEIDAALQKAMDLRRNRLLKAMDGDKNGSIAKAELDQFVSGLMASVDADSDGGVTLEEIRKFRVAKMRKPATAESTN